MARIRTIKPDFFSSPDTASASYKARLLYIAMWCWADDYGVGRTNLQGIAGFAFEHDDTSASELQTLLSEVQTCFGVVFYSVGGRYYYSIPSWDDHQKTQRRANRRDPGPDHPEAAPDQRFNGVLEPSGRTQGSSEPTQGNAPSGRGRGTGEEEEEQGKREVAVRDQARKRATRIPEGFTPSPEVIDAMRTECPNVNLEAENRKFVDYWAAKAGKDATKLDWDATWRNWIRRAKDSNVAQFPARQTASEKSQGWLDTVDEAVRLMGGNQ